MHVRPTWLVALGACGLLASACAPSSDEACKAAAAAFERCASKPEDKWGDKQQQLCKTSLDTIAEKDQSTAKDHAKAIAKCAKMTDCDTAQKCLMLLLVDDAQQARELGCAKGKAEDCLEAASRYLHGGAGTSKDETKAAALLETACNGGSSVACELYAKALRDGRGVPQDEAKANTLFQQACEKGTAGACTALGLGAMKKGDFATAVSKLGQGCSGKDGLGCASLGGMYLNGKGVEKDADKARTFLKKACDLKIGMACETLKSLGE